jgi:hypothetical protein
MQDAKVIQGIEDRFRSLVPLMDERMRRQWAAAESRTYGWGGVRAVSRATGLAPNTIKRGLAELEAREAKRAAEIPTRIRRPGGGRKRATQADPQLAQALERLVDPATRGDPQSPLKWTCKSTTQLARELTRQGHPASARTVGRLLRAAGYSLQSNRKTKEGANHPDRNAQFEYISQTVKAFQRRGQPVISVDTKKKELVGNFKNGGREWQLRGEPTEVVVHDFLDKTLGESDSLRRVRRDAEPGLGERGNRPRHRPLRRAGHLPLVAKVGSKSHRGAKELLIVADGGGSNGSRSRLWKVALQELADRLGLTIQVCHFPPGTSKWNKIEHRMF